MAKECGSCAGKGIHGTGAFPLKMEGHTVTCETCTGKGVVEEATPSVETPTEEVIPEEAPTETVSEEVVPSEEVVE